MQKPAKVAKSEKSLEKLKKIGENWEKLRKFAKIWKKLQKLGKVAKSRKTPCVGSIGKVTESLYFSTIV